MSGPAVRERGARAAEPDRAPDLSSRARLLLWDYARGSIPYDLLCLALVLLLLAVPPGCWADPMIGHP
ncbi:MAG: hypothetical protein DMF80_18620 [Acidobacteria bacterium]|nr:MAG: hypothetical protein DMF80_18620 [Acidobacteriota bacterium]